MSEWNWDLIVRVFQGLLTPVIGGVAVYIAWQQYQSNSAKLQLDTYDRRLRIYQELLDLLRAVMRNADASWDDLGKFARGTAEADFLFGDDISAYLREVYSRCLKLRQANQQYRDYTQEIPPGYDHTKVVDEKHAALNWLMKQDEIAKNKFRPHLRIGR
jgi:hypothetical protein